MNPCDREYIEMAIKIASESAANGGGPFGCVIVREGAVIATASNRVTLDNDPTSHAEVNAIREACSKLKTFELEGCILYTSCEPCPMCLAACYWAHIKKIYYSGDQVDAARAGFDDNHIYKEMSVDKCNRRIPIERIEAERGKDPFKVWEQNEKKVRY